MRRFLWKVWTGNWESIKLLLFVVAPFATLVPLVLQLGEGNSAAVEWVQIFGAGAVVAILLWAVWQNWRRVSRRAVQARARYGRQLEALLAEVKASTTPVGDYARQVVEHVTTIYCGPRQSVVIDAAQGQPMSIARVARAMWADAPTFETELVRRVRQMHARWNEATDHPEIQVNAPHALVLSTDLPESFDPTLTSLKYQKCDYVVLRAALEIVAESVTPPRPNAPHVMGAGGLLVYPDQQEVLFLKRSAQSDTHAYKWHVFGGNFEPDMRLPGRGSDRDLKANAEREILEESGALVDVDGAILIVHRERADSNISGSAEGKPDWRREMRYVPIHYCGLTLSREQYRRINPSPEGDIAAIQFGDLGNALADTSRWVPVAWWTVVSWLWLGAPCQDGEPIFSRTEARRIVRQLLTRT